ncbi:hypothetical protein SAMN04487861_12029 [Selenomonas ruminantium]|uniref:Uncharacterized protein n=1 Tax=Selenomonas ruminantium TaxID=971 RepID=A0A1I3G6A6_SELRU|nr:hypothetical protein SAMN04487861_12029 [Selenomonas ruminantium]
MILLLMVPIFIALVIFIFIGEIKKGKLFY